MKAKNILFVFFALLLIPGCSRVKPPSGDFWDFAVTKKTALRLSVYITAQTADQMLTTEEGRRETVSLLRCNGITRVYLEVYRGGLVITPETIGKSVAFLKESGFEVAGGICTVPGNDFGVSQQGTFTWFNWQNPKTQNDMRKIMEDSAPFFDTFIIDDFLCTSDTSLESKEAKGNSDWSEYRRALMTRLSQSVFINPARAKNPEIKVVIKYPQWYDRFHLFGYDVRSETEIFDGVSVGTETRGQFTPDFGYVQPYEGFINFRWLSTLAGQKTRAAWFDHIDCNDNDFIGQAYQSVIAGAKELIIFNFENIIMGHPGHHLLRQDFGKLADLAGTIADNPVMGATGYKPPNSDAGGDLYIMDYIGMLGISLIPDSKYPDKAGVIFLPTQAAADRDIPAKILKSLESGSRLIMTTGFVANANGGEKLAQLARIKWPLSKGGIASGTIVSKGNQEKLKIPLNMDYRITPDGADILLQSTGGETNPFLTCNPERNVFVINSHTFSQQDFDAAGEVLLCPTQIGLLELPKSWVNTIRSAFEGKNEPVMDAPSRVTMQQLTNGDCIIHNYNAENANINIRFPDKAEYMDKFTGKTIPLAGNDIKLEMIPGSRLWLGRRN